MSEAPLAGSSFGALFRITTFGESHGAAVGCVIDGCPAGVPLDQARLAAWLARRRPGHGPLVSARAEPDEPRILSGVYQGLTIGSPIAIVVDNTDARSSDYDRLGARFRPGHADLTWTARFGHRDPRGGGRASARETVGRVAGGAVAEALLDALADAEGRPRTEVIGWVQRVAEIEAVCLPPGQVTHPDLPRASGYAIDPLDLTRDAVDASPVRCPDAKASAAMVAAIEAARSQCDSLGGLVRCVVRGVPAGWGDPTFDKLTASLAHALCSLPAVKGLAFGSGFEAMRMRGSQHNDAFLRSPSGCVATATNHAGGMLGGISNGMPLLVDVAFKPVATIAQPQHVMGETGEPELTTLRGRHDPCVLPRAVPIVEAAIALVLADHALRQRAARVDL